MDCLTNLVGIKGDCGTPTTPSANLWLNDLPAITIKSSNAAVNAEQESGYDLLSQKLAFADNIIEQDVRAHLAPYISLSSIVDNDVIGKYQDDLPLVSSESGRYKGIQIKIDEYPYLSLFVSSIRLQLTSAITTDILVFDLISGKQIDSFEITSVADEITEVIVNKSYKATRQKLNLLFVYDAGVASARKSTAYGTSSGCSTCRGNWDYNYASFRGASIGTGATKTNVNVSAENSTAGMSLTYSLSCDIEPFICSISSLLGMPKLYLTGSLVMQEYIFSDRLNHIVTVQKEDHKALQMEYSNEYMSRMGALLENMKLPKDGLCFRCDPPIRKRVQVP